MLSIIVGTCLGYWVLHHKQGLILSLVYGVVVGLFVASNSYRDGAGFLVPVLTVTGLFIGWGVRWVNWLKSKSTATKPVLGVNFAAYYLADRVAFTSPQEGLALIAAVSRQGLTRPTTQDDIASLQIYATATSQAFDLTPKTFIETSKCVQREASVALQMSTTKANIDGYLAQVQGERSGEVDFDQEQNEILEILKQGGHESTTIQFNLIRHWLLTVFQNLNDKSIFDFNDEANAALEKTIPKFQIPQ